MILAAAVVLGLFASFLRHRGRTIQQIAAIPVQSAWLALLALGLQLPLLRTPGGPVSGIRLQQAVFLLSHVLLLAFVWRNRRLAGILIVGAGLICNLLVIAANDGFMPITPETLVNINPGSTEAQWPVGIHYGYSKDVIRDREDTRFWILSDILVARSPFFRPTAFSTGDLVIAAGVAVLLQGPTARRELGSHDPASA